MAARDFDAGGVPLRISRSGYTGEDGFEISIPAVARGRFRQPCSPSPMSSRSVSARRDSLRLEAGLCLYGHDIDATTIRSRPGSHGRSASGAATRAAFPAPPIAAAIAHGRRAAASGFSSRARRRRGKAPTSRRRRAGARPRDLGRLRAEPRPSDRHGLCRGRRRKTGASVISSFAARPRRRRHATAFRAASLSQGSLDAGHSLYQGP